MPKSKNALALLEVLRRSDMKPAGGDSNDSPTGQSARPAAQQASPASQAQPAQQAQPASQASPAQQVSPAKGGSPQALVRSEGDRLKFSVSTLMLAMVLFAVFVMLAGAFALGRHLGYDSGWQAAADRAKMIADDEFREIREQPPSPGVLQDLDVVTDAVNLEHARQRRAAHAGRPGFIDDLNYVWIEAFVTKGDATTARGYLKNKGIDSTLIASGSKWVLVSSEGFDYKLPEEKAACQQLSARVREVGQQYLEAGGRYGFKCYVKKKTPGSTW